MRAAAIACCWLGLASQALAGDLTLQIRDGRVTLNARDVSVREILTEWARVGDTTFVNGDRIDGPPVTLQLVDTDEIESPRPTTNSPVPGMVDGVPTPGARVPGLPPKPPPSER